MGTDARKGSYTSPDGSKTWEYLAVFSCSILALCIGLVVGWNSPTVVLLLAPDSPIPLTSSDIATLVATVTIGHMVAPPLNMLLVDTIGRKKTILLSGLPLIVSWGLIMVAKSAIVLYLARFIAGLALGLSICVTPMYAGEISSADTRGIGGSLLGVFYNFGVLFAFVVVPYMTITAMAGIFLVMSMGFVALFWFMPESPYYLAMKNRIEEAEEMLEKLRGKTDVSDELRTIVESVSNDNKSKKDALKDLFVVRANRKAFFIIVLFAISLHFGGLMTILTYGQLIFKESSNNSFVSDHTANIIVGATQLFSATLTSCLVDKVGRKPLVLFSGVVGGLCNAMIGSFFYAKEYLHLDVSAYSIVLSASSMLLVFAFNCGLMSIHIVITSEIFASDVKATGTCMIGIVSGLIGTVTCKLYILVAITWRYGHSLPFMFFAVAVWACTAAILYITPETKGKTFAQIQKELDE